MKKFQISFNGAPEFGLKKPVLWVTDGNKSTKVASFNSKDAAMLFSEALTEQLHMAASGRLDEVTE